MDRTSYLSRHPHHPVPACCKLNPLFARLAGHPVARPRGQGAGCRVQGAGCRVQGVRCRVQGVNCRVQGAGCRV